MADVPACLKSDYLVAQVHNNLAALQRAVRVQPVKVMRTVLRTMRQYEQSARREDVFVPELGCTTGEFAVLHLLRPYDHRADE
jgi:hypothetical protein